MWPLCLCCGESKRNLKLEHEIIHYLHNRYGLVLAEWLQDVIVGRFTCIRPEDQRGNEFGVWGCKIDAERLSNSEQETELERRAVEYTQEYMGETFADFLNRVFCGRYQQGFVDDRSGKEMIVILTQPLYLLMDDGGRLAVVPYTDGDLSRTGVFASERSPNAQGRSSEASFSHKQCVECGRVLTPDTCFKCSLPVCRNCSSKCDVCKISPLCLWCKSIREHRCLPQRALPSL